MSELYRDFIDGNADAIINSLGGTITPAPANAELYRDFLDRKFDDVITALNGSITPEPVDDELYRDFIERKFDDVIAGIGSYIPPVSFPTVSGSIVTFNSQYAGLPLKSHTVAVTATQSGSGTPSPSNPRPITGYSAINISHSDADTSNPTVYTIQIGSTVYGGEYDARTGVLTVMPTAPTLDKDSYWIRNASGIFYVPTHTGMTDLTMCNMFEVIGKGSASGLANYQCRMSANGRFINFRVNSCDTLEDFKTWLGDNVITIWGTFTNTSTIQLPPCPIDTLEGVNNIWADTGDIDLTYKDLDIAKRGNFREVFRLPS